MDTKWREGKSSAYRGSPTSSPSGADKVAQSLATMNELLARRTARCCKQRSARRAASLGSWMAKGSHTSAALGQSAGAASLFGTQVAGARLSDPVHSSEQTDGLLGAMGGRTGCCGRGCFDYAGALPPLLELVVCDVQLQPQRCQLPLQLL